METSQHPPQRLDSLACESRTLDPGILSVIEERLRALDPTAADPGSASELLGLLASMLHNTCSGRIAEDYVDGPQGAMQDCVRLASAMVSWMAQGGVAAVSSSPETCASLKDFIASALALASHAFFSSEWYEQLGPARYVQTGNAVRGYVKDLTPAALDATESCWRAVEQQLACGDPTGEELMEACRALFGALFEGLRHLGTTSAERINDPAVPREMRSFAGLNILWTGLSRIMTALPPEAQQHLLSGCAVQSVLRALLGYLSSEVRALASSRPGGYETRLKVSRFWLQHAARVVQAHPAVAAACWDELAATTADVYGRIATAGSTAAAAADGQSSQEPPTSQQQKQSHQQFQTQMARDLDSAIACKMTSLLAVVLDVESSDGSGTGGGGGDGDGPDGGAPHGVASLPASPQQLEARLAKLEILAQGLCARIAPGSAAAVGGGVAAAFAAGATASPAVAAAAGSGAVLLCLSLLQRAAHVSPQARAVMVSRSLPWVGVATAVNLYSLALQQCGPAAATPSLDLPHQLAAAALSLLAAAAEQQAGGGRDIDTFAAGCAVVCNWGACAHPLLSAAAADVLSTLVQHCEQQLAVRLIAAVARLAGLAAAAEAVAAAAAALDSAEATAPAAVASFGGGISGRLERLLVNMLAAASPQAEPAWREILRQHLAPLPSQPTDLPGMLHGNDCFTAAGGGGGGLQHGAAAPTSLDLCGAASARVLWGAAAAATVAVQAAPSARTGARPSEVPVVGFSAVSEQELGDRGRQLLAAVRQAAVLGSFGDISGAGASDEHMAYMPTTLTRQWLAQLLGCLEVTVVHVRCLGLTRLQPLVSEAAELAGDLLQALFERQPANGSCTGAPDGGASGSGRGCGGDIGSRDADVATAHAAARLVALAADCMNPAALAALAPALTWLAQRGPAAAAADVAAAAAHCNAPPPEALFHSLLRSPHAAVMHLALQSQVHVCRTVPQQYAASVRRLFPPDFAPAAAAPAATAAQAQLPTGGPPAQLAAVFKSYMLRRVTDDEVAAALAAAPQACAAEGQRLAEISRVSCSAGDDAAALGPMAPPALLEAVKCGAEAIQACMGALTLRRAGYDGSCGGGGSGDPMATDATDAILDTLESDGGGSGGLQPQNQAPLISQQRQRPQQQQPQTAGPVAGPLTSLVADDNAAMNVLKNALGGLERSLGSLHAAVVAHGINKGRASDWDQLQVHARALLGDLSSATSRIRNMNELLYALQGR